MKKGRVFDFFLFLSKSERNGSLLLLTIIGLLLTVRLILPMFFTSEKIKKYEFSNGIDQFEEPKDSTLHLTVVGKGTNATGKRAIGKVDNQDEDILIHKKLFQFNPNEVSYEDLIKLGFSQSSARNLINYRLKGGVFKTPDDVRKIYGVDSSLFASICPYIFMKNEAKVDILIEINTADTAMFSKLKGIGPVFASRICKYRNQLGGFNSIEQLKEVYQFPIETYNRIHCFLTIDMTGIKRINVNFTGIDELKKHPYCKYENARKIIDYRSRNGFIKSIESLVRDTIIDSTTFKRLSPYLKIE